MRHFIFVFAPMLAALSGYGGNLKGEPQWNGFKQLAEEYVKETRPLLQQFCLDCHSSKKRAGEMDLEQFFTLADVRVATREWLKVSEMLNKSEMPPSYSKQPEPQQRQKMHDWVQRYLHAEAMANAGDPGPVVLRRLNNAEFTYTVQDLTGFDLDPTREFPADGAAGEGFTNVGDALVMSPSLIQKYMDAGKGIARHVVLMPDGFRFSPYTTRRDWTDEILTEIRELYGKFSEPVDLGPPVGYVNSNSRKIGLAGLLPLEKYLEAALVERNSLASGQKSVETVANERGLSSLYLGKLWTSLSASEPSLLLDHLRANWRSANPQDASSLAGQVRAWQKGLWMFEPVGLIGREGGPSRWMEPVNPLVTRQELCFTIPQFVSGYEREEVAFSLVATDAGDGNRDDFVVWKKPRLVADGRPDILLRDVRSIHNLSTQSSGQVAEWGLDPDLFGKHPNGYAIDPESLCVRAPSVIQIRLPEYLANGYDFVTTAVLEEQSGREGSVQVDLVGGTNVTSSGLLPSEVLVTFSKVTQVFSDRKSVSFSRPILISENSSLRSRFESAFEDYRELFPVALCFTQIVPVDEILTITLFYREDDHLVHLMLDEAQKAKLDRLWEELHYVSQSALLRVTALDLLLEAFQGNGLADRSQYNAHKPLRELFESSATDFKQQLIDDESTQVDALIAFSTLAYRRPLTGREEQGIRGLYRQLRDQELSHDEAFRLALARVFVSMPFLYRLEVSPPGNATAKVLDWELANRLSYFLWSSQPDEKLRSLAATGRIQTPQILTKQSRRMLKDVRVRRLATEFACHWLHIQDFDSLVEKSEKHFPEFGDLRADMYEESIRFFTNFFQSDASLLSLLDADHTFLNESLARFYGIKEVKGTAWRRVDGIRSHGRGGILGFATTLARQSGASRTSPILRGNWISEVLLGEKLPRPPQDVPQLPPDEIETNGLTMRQLVARHTSDPQCANCHQRIDPFGFALEAYDAIGRHRQRDLANRSINTQTTLPDGTVIDGLSGLRDYLKNRRRDVIFRQFYRKLLGYSLGREVQLSDQPLLTEMQEKLEINDHRISEAIGMIVRSRQFREIRGKETHLVQSP